MTCPGSAIPQEQEHPSGSVVDAEATGTTGAAHQVPGDVPVFCPKCSYDLRSLSSDVCPECGLAIDYEALRESQIPWVHRQKLRRFSGFWKTASLVSFRSKRLQWEMAQPVDLKEALRFRLRVVWLLWVAVLVFVGMIYGSVEHAPSSWPEHWVEGFGFLSLNFVLCLMPVLLWFWLYGITGLHTYGFHPKSMAIEAQNRAVALSYYACAPLVWLAVALLVGGGCLYLANATDPDTWGGAYSEFFNSVFIVSLIGAGLMGLLAVLSLAGYWGVCRQLRGWLTNRGGMAKAVLLFMLPVGWVVLAGLLFGAIPVVFLYVSLIWMTLR